MLKGDEEQSSLGSKLNKNKSKEKGSQCAWKDVEMGGGRCDLCPFWHSNHPQTASLLSFLLVSSFHLSGRLTCGC